MFGVESSTYILNRIYSVSIEIVEIICSPEISKQSPLVILNFMLNVNL